MSPLPDDKEPGCGYGLFKTGEDDPLLRACDVHDARYGQHEVGKEFEPYSQARADREFLNNSLRLAGGSKILKARAYIYYGLIRTFGWLVW